MFDQDEEAWENLLDDPRIIPVKANFSFLQKFLRFHNLIPVTGILADLGVSSWQLNSAERGFSYRFEGPLDMRMNTNDSLTARDVLNTYSQEGLQHILSEYGEVTNAKSLANSICEYRINKEFETTSELKILAESQARGNVFSYFCCFESHFGVASLCLRLRAFVSARTQTVFLSFQAFW